ncbi:MAG: hypothetical protein K2L48_02900 [Mycoplasmoidaceae bacterium]|nr:hypothetical protein [Mycoplasmoidaceae bacterium]
MNPKFQSHGNGIKSGMLDCTSSSFNIPSHVLIAFTSGNEAIPIMKTIAQRPRVTQIKAPKLKLVSIVFFLFKYK